MRRAPAPALALALTVALVLSGCSALPGGTGLDRLPLPGGADLGSHPYEGHRRVRGCAEPGAAFGRQVNDVAVAGHRYPARPRGLVP
ncbi:hypothetical protein SSCG_05106, partial [Streptomyces clavuligerus]